MKIIERCEYCKFYDDKEYYCRRYPPKLFIIGGSPVDLHTSVSKTEWCGEFMRSELFQSVDKV